MASRISRRRQQSIERRFSASLYAAQLAQDVLKLGDGVEFEVVDRYGNPKKYGWAAFPPQGLQPVEGDSHVGSKEDGIKFF